MHNKSSITNIKIIIGQSQDIDPYALRKTIGYINLMSYKLSKNK